MSTGLDSILNVGIDPAGKYKYVLISVHLIDPSTGKKTDDHKFVVRGYADCAYHADIYEKFEAEINPIRKQIKTSCVGGGRILRSGNKINVFGYSQGFGRADHEVTVAVLKKEFPNDDISWSNDGY